jgi:dihydroneopterin aldolase
MKHKIEVNGIQLYAFHGCLEEEARIGGKYTVDVLITTDFSDAAKSDDLSKTVDYVVVNAIVTEEMAIRSKLIEHVGLRILNRLKAEISHGWLLTSCPSQTAIVRDHHVGRTSNTSNPEDVNFIIDFAMIDYHIAYCLAVAEDPACRRCLAPLRPHHCRPRHCPSGQRRESWRELSRCVKPKKSPLFSF